MRAVTATGETASTTVTAAAMRAARLSPATLVRRTAAKAWQDRVLGLAAEAGFWQLLSLPPLLLAVLGTIGYIGDALGSSAVGRVEVSLLRAATKILTPSAVDELVRPTVDEVLRRGRADVISIGFLVSLWTGSTAMSTYVNTITIAYGLREHRSAVRSRILALKLYLAQVASGIVLIPALVLGPTLLQRVLHAHEHPVVHTLVTVLYWPVVAVLSLGMLTTLYHLSVPGRTPWRRALPGAMFTVVLWVLGSYLLRLYLRLVFGDALVYGSLAAPVAVLLFFYITALAVLLGAELNATIDLLRRPGRTAGPDDAGVIGPVDDTAITIR